MTRSERAATEAQIRRRYLKVGGVLTERARRLFVASEALAVGHGGIAAASRATGMAASVIGRGIAEVRGIEQGTAALPPTRSRRPGGGRKRATAKDPTLLPDLQALVESTTRGMRSRRCCGPPGASGTSWPP